MPEILAMLNTCAIGLSASVLLLKGLKPPTSEKM
jgi:hypothetical protein